MTRVVLEEAKFNSNEMPWPLENDSVEELVLGYEIEHGIDPVSTLMEAHRVCAKGARVSLFANGETINFRVEKEEG